MNYNKTAAGKRISSQRKRLGLTRGQMADSIGKTEKYYSDIERGYCGMSLETMIGISECLGLTLDYMIFGEEADSQETMIGIADVLGVSLDYITFGEDFEDDLPGEAKRILFYLNHCGEQKRKKALQLLQVYLAE